VNNSNEEEIINLKGYTYNLDGEKIVKDKLTKEAIFDEQVSDNWHLEKFTMPNVKEGSVIEFSYTIKSDNAFNFREWEFQYTIPVLWSEYRATFPEYFNYKQLSQGYEPYYINEKKSVSETFTVKYDAESRTGMNGGRTSAGVENFTSNSTAYRWVTKDVPAMREEPFMTTVNDYINKIEFELASTHFPGQHVKTYSNSWNSLTDLLLKNEYFGIQLNKTGFAKNELNAIAAKFTEPEQKIIAIYEFARKSVKWNGIKQKYAESTTKKAYENRTGNAADINLMLVALLREAGLDANPVILSTRDHGRLLKSYALLNKFNYVIAHVNLNGKDYLLDATDPVIGHGMLPTRCLNGEGWLVNEKSGRWISLQTNERFAQVFSAKVNLDKDGELKGTINVSKVGTVQYL
jgi:transglutaminase-like putative cysteine protease